MLKQLIKISIFWLMIVVAAPVFADDTELLPEAVPGEDDQQQDPMSHQATVQTRTKTLSDPADENSKPLSLEEEHAIAEDQAQFEAEQNALRTAANNNATPKSAEDNLEQGRENLEHDAQLNNKRLRDEDIARTKADKQMLKQYGNISSQDEDQQASGDNAFFNPTTQEQRNLQKYQLQQQYTPSRSDW